MIESGPEVIIMHAADLDQALISICTLMCRLYSPTSWLRVTSLYFV